MIHLSSFFEPCTQLLLPTLKVPSSYYKGTPFIYHALLILSMQVYKSQKKNKKKKNKLSSLLWTQENESNKKSTWYIVNVYCTETNDLKVLNVIAKKLPIYLFQAL